MHLNPALVVCESKMKWSEANEFLSRFTTGNSGLYQKGTYAPIVVLTKAMLKEIKWWLSTAVRWHYNRLQCFTIFFTLQKLLAFILLAYWLFKLQVASPLPFDTFCISLSVKLGQHSIKNSCYPQMVKNNK